MNFLMLNIVNSYTYMERLNKLNLWTLEERRNRSDLIEVFKMAKNLVTNTVDQILRKLNSEH